MSKRLKLKKNDFGLRIHCSVCRKTFNEVSIKKCSHSDKQKYRVVVNIPLEGGVKSQKLKTKDYSKAIEEAVKFKNKVKKGEFTVVSKQKKAIVTEQNLLLIQAADDFVNQKKGKVEYTFLEKDDLTEDYVESVIKYL